MAEIKRPAMHRPPIATIHGIQNARDLYGLRKLPRSESMPVEKCWKSYPANNMVGSTGIEPVTPSMSRKCATTTLTARGAYILTQKLEKKWRRHPDLNWGMEVLQTSALPLGYAAISNWRLHLPALLLT